MSVVSDIFNKYKKRLITGVAIILVAIATYFVGGTVDWGKVGTDALKGEVTEGAQVLEDAAAQPQE